MEGIPLPVVLRSGTETVDLLAYVDTGAGNCLFAREHGEMLALDVEAGERKSFRTANGRIETFGHVVSLEVLGLKLEAMVYFFADEWINKNFARSSRAGLTELRFGLVEHGKRCTCRTMTLEYWFCQKELCLSVLSRFTPIYPDLPIYPRFARFTPIYFDLPDLP